MIEKGSLETSQGLENVEKSASPSALVCEDSKEKHFDHSSPCDVKSNHPNPVVTDQSILSVSDETTIRNYNADNSSSSHSDLKHRNTMESNMNLLNEDSTCEADGVISVPKIKKNCDFNALSDDQVIGPKFGNNGTKPPVEELKDLNLNKEKKSISKVNNLPHTQILPKNSIIKDGCNQTLKKKITFTNTVTEKSTKGNLTLQSKCLTEQHNPKNVLNKLQGSLKGHTNGKPLLRIQSKIQNIAVQKLATQPMERGIARKGSMTF